jgi:hypothetical protein
MKNKCNPKFEDCEMAMLKIAADKAEKRIGKEQLSSTQVKKIVKVVEKFLRDKKLICYGGTAINNILPERARFYDTESEFPDYDFFSPEPLNDAKELADIYKKEGFAEVEAKSGMHAGTFKVFVNFLPIADITYLVPELFNALKKNAFEVDNILYVPPDFLRMSMHLELSRPKGDPGRWQKVYKRLKLLNKYYPPEKCIKHSNYDTKQSKLSRDIFGVMANEAVVFFGYIAVKAMDLGSWPEFDVMAKDPKKTASKLAETLRDKGYKNVKTHKYKNVGEVIPESFQVSVNRKKVAFIYSPLGCHSYNVIKWHGKSIKIATTDTMLSLYLAFSYANRKHYNLDRILCLASRLHKAQLKYKSANSGVFKRFTLKCLGKQHTIQNIREEKAKMYKRLRKYSAKRIKNSKYLSRLKDYYFLKYTP